jgi:hypothetical protein
MQATCVYYKGICAQALALYEKGKVKRDDDAILRHFPALQALESSVQSWNDFLSGKGKTRNDLEDEKEEIKKG